MQELEICPNCSTEFVARRALVSSGVPLGFNIFTFSDVAVRVRCPGCQGVFSARKDRFFGILSPNGVRWLVLAMLAICMALVVR
jgi:hypothetical protein